jgi:hypothetical protein
MEVTSFTCSICGDRSHKICVYCTKDACNNHLCHRCLRCSECCTCDMPTTDDEEAVELVEEMIEPLTPTLT